MPAAYNRPQNVQTYVALQIDVGMINFCVTAYFWRLMRIGLTNDKTEYKLTASVDTLASTIDPVAALTILNNYKCTMDARNCSA